MTENPYPLSGVLQVGDLRVGPYMWLEACARADRAEFLLALIFAANDPRLTTKDGSRWVRADRRDEAEVRAQAAEAALSALRTEVGEVLGALKVEPRVNLQLLKDHCSAGLPQSQVASLQNLAFRAANELANFRALAQLHAELTEGRGGES
jgi:hypothetical protein